jgi:hypothetical protein
MQATYDITWPERAEWPLKEGSRGMAFSDRQP